MSETDNGQQIAADIEQLAKSVTTQVLDAVQQAGTVTMGNVKRLAARPRTLPSVAGLPPRLQTGDYNRSIGLKLTRTSTTATASIGSDKPQAARLELGYDSGHQRTLPHPHYAPSLDVGSADLEKRIEAIIGRQQ